MSDQRNWGHWLWMGLWDVEFRAFGCGSPPYYFGIWLTLSIHIDGKECSVLIVWKAALYWGKTDITIFSFFAIHIAILCIFSWYDWHMDMIDMIDTFCPRWWLSLVSWLYVGLHDIGKNWHCSILFFCDVVYTFIAWLQWNYLGGKKSLFYSNWDHFVI